MADVWDQLPDFQGNARGNASVVIANNKLYVIGGFNSTSPFPIDTWSLDLGTNQWLRTGLIDHIRPEAAFTYDNKVYLLHSFFNYFGYNELRFSEFDPETNTIGKDYYMFPGSYTNRPGICLFYNGVLYFGLGIFGGYGECLNELWKFTF